MSLINRTPAGLHLSRREMPETQPQFRDPGGEMATQPNLQSLGMGAFGLQALPTLKPIPSAPGYLAGDDESIWSTRRGPLHRLKTRKDKDGYLRVNLSIDGEHQT